MDEEYDVVVAGAGPAGAQAARDLAARDYDVAVLEAEPGEDYPSTSNKSTAGTFPRMMAEFDIPDEVVMQHTDSVVLESPDDSYGIDTPGAILDFGDFKEFLVEEGEQNGADYFFGSRVYEPVVEDGTPQGVRYTDGEIGADIIIDATGPSAPIAQHEDVGIVDLDRSNQAIGIEYELDGVEPDQEGSADLTEAMMLRLDHDIAPGGYSWLFHTGEDTAKVGVCYIQNEQHERQAQDGKTIDDYLQDWIVDDPRFQEQSREEVDPEEVHRGSAHIQMPEKYSSDSVMAVGDTVPSVDPLWGEGIDTAMKSGRAAAVTADAALTPGKIGGEVDTSDLSGYDQRWEDDVAPSRKERFFLTHALYNMDNDRYDQLMEDLREADLDDLAELNQGNLLKARRMVHAGDAGPMLRALRETGRQSSERFRKADEWVNERLDI